MHASNGGIAAPTDSMRNFELQLIQSGPTMANIASGSGPVDYPSMNSHGANSSMFPNTMLPQFSEEENDILLQKDNIYKKVSDLFALLKQGEDEA